MASSFPKYKHPTGRYFINEAFRKPKLMQSMPNPYDHLVASLKNILDICPPSVPWTGCFAGGLYFGIFAGPTSIAFLFLWLSKTHPDLAIHGLFPADYCKAYLSLQQNTYSSEETPRSGCSLNHEFMCYNAVKACLTKDITYVQKFAENIDKLTLRPTFMELLFGRAGLLSLMRTMKYWFPESSEILDPEIEKVIQHCLSYDPWTFGVRPDNQKRFIGASHGDIAIISNIVMTNPAYAPKVQGRLEKILALQADNGNWLTCEDEGEDLVQFCHGAPGNAFALAEPQRSHFLHYATPSLVRAGLLDGTLEGGSDNSGVWWSEASRAWGWMMHDYDRAGLGDSVEDIGYPGATNP
ncbi:hypothetical protein TWF970_000417 [Orbilia oligospora]|uniref:Linalool dehydratase/isomerase domain-containing protein n=1 Tax=Orbilia oligospora TaxID=2813651 RepID=A0A7C8RMX4_ORBOL|nr:hypothetical protein TWF970_000417 [Orbilia oligospora]